MSEQNRFFVWVGRLAALSLLLGAIAICSLIVYEFVGRDRFDGDGAVVASPPGEEAPRQDPLRVGGIQRVKGTDVKVIELYRGGHGGKFSRDHYKRTAHNLIFVRDGERKAHWLFQNDAQSFSYEQLCNCEENDKASAVAVFLEVQRKDSNADGDIDGSDEVVPALVRVDGTGYTELGGPVGSVLDRSISADQSTLSLLISHRGKLLYRDYDLTTFRLRSEQALVSLQR